jgi:hypothetical protein
MGNKQNQILGIRDRRDCGPSQGMSTCPKCDEDRTRNDPT